MRFSKGFTLTKREQSLNEMNDLLKRSYVGILGIK
jgi:hypothetical protein